MAERITIKKAKKMSTKLLVKAFKLGYEFTPGAIDYVICERELTDDQMGIMLGFF